MEAAESASPFHPSRTNKIIMIEVNLAFIGPHRLFVNHFCLRSLPQFATWTIVYFPQPPFIPICHALPFSRFIQDHRSDSSLISNPFITCHVPLSTGHLDNKQRASLHPGNISNRWWKGLSLLRHQIGKEIFDSVEFPDLILRATSCSGIAHSRRCDQPLFVSRWIRWNLSNFAGLRHCNHHASLRSRIVNRHWSTSPLILNRQINGHLLILLGALDLSAVYILAPESILTMDVI